MIKISVLGIKEGIGKTTISLALAKELSKEGRTLLVDKTPSCGLWRKIGLDGDFACQGQLCFLKLFKRPFRIEELDEDSIKSKLISAYKERWDYVVIDNFSCAVPENPIIGLDVDSLPIFVTDPFNVRVTLEYSERFFRKYGLIINLTQREYKINKEISKLFQISVSIPVTEENDVGLFLLPLIADLKGRKQTLYE
ncbi:MULTISPECIES: nucleotide-binding protein [Metallosphaera]|uniref:CobQ/CobB/MinD/ParA nucleotide binding domain-containing protein n=1 Tax=Metallosphaera cuprina (strain Ar-4) TaxID=1006006 RepID=F4G0W6_METCR|nr:cobyric acid synthase CobQ [Metallosphaera cuprina]AEB95925.1 conserved hypothetical protein [Metallosphaera cuprina Ar-4]